MVKLNTKFNKKGNLMDYVEVGMTFLIVVVVMFVFYSVLTNFSSSLDLAETGGNYTSFIEGSRDKLTTSTDWSMLAFLVAALIFSVIMARRIPTEPLFIGIVLVLSFAMFLISFVISNIFGGFMDNVAISNFVNLNMPITQILLQYFPFITAIYLGVVMIAFFGGKD